MAPLQPLARRQALWDGLLHRRVPSVARAHTWIASTHRPSCHDAPLALMWMGADGAASEG